MTTSTITQQSNYPYQSLSSNTSRSLPSFSPMNTCQKAAELFGKHRCQEGEDPATPTEPKVSKNNFFAIFGIVVGVLAAIATAVAIPFLALNAMWVALGLASAAFITSLVVIGLASAAQHHSLHPKKDSPPPPVAPPANTSSAV